MAKEPFKPEDQEGEGAPKKSGGGSSAILFVIVLVAIIISTNMQNSTPAVDVIGGASTENITEGSIQGTWEVLAVNQSTAVFAEMTFGESAASVTPECNPVSDIAYNLEEETRTLSFAKNVARTRRACPEDTIDFPYGYDYDVSFPQKDSMVLSKQGVSELGGGEVVITLQRK